MWKRASRAEGWRAGILGPGHEIGFHGQEDLQGIVARELVGLETELSCRGLGAGPTNLRSPVLLGLREPVVKDLI